MTAARSSSSKGGGFDRRASELAKLYRHDVFPGEGSASLPISATSRQSRPHVGRGGGGGTVRGPLRCRARPSRQLESDLSIDNRPRSAYS